MNKKIIFAALAVVVGLSLCGLVYCWYNSALQVMLVNVSGMEMCCKLSVRDKVVCETTIKPSCAEIVKLRDYAEGGLYAVVNGKAYSEAVNYLSPGIDRPFALVLVDEDNAPIVCEIEESTKLIR